MANNPIKASNLYQDDGAILAAIEQLKTLGSTYEKALDKIGKEAITLQVNLKKLNQTQSDHREEIKKSATVADKLAREQEKYTQALDKTNVEIQSLKLAQQELNRISKLEAKLARSKKDSYNALSAQYSINKIRINQMSTAERQLTKEGRALVKQTKSIYEEMNRLQKVTGKSQLQVGRYGIAAKKLTASLKAWAGAYLGLSAAARTIQSIFTTTKQLDALDMAYKQVLGTQERVAKADQFLSDITKNYGLELLTTRKAYLKYLAAIKTTNITAEEGEQIFRSFAKAGAILGLTADENKGVFLALEQMISKGKVSAEELRLQLGERMPGAFQIMAKSIGVTTLELSKMLERGEVISEDVLPNFAKEIERTFGIENLNKVDTLAAAQARLSNEWINFVDALSASDTFRSVIGSLSSMLGLLNDFVEIPVSEKLREQQTELNTLVGALINVNDTVEDTNLKEEVRSRLISEIQSKYPDFIKNIDLETASINELKDALSQANDGYTKKIILQRQEEDLNKIFEKRATLFEDLVRLQKEQASGKIRLSTNVIGGGIGDTTVDEDIARTQALIKKLDEDAATITARRAAEIAEINKLLGDQTSETEKSIKAASDQQKTFSTKAAKTKKELEAAAGSVAFFRDEVRRLSELVEKSSPEQSKGLLTELLGAEQSLEEAENYVSRLRDLLKNTPEELSALSTLKPLVEFGITDDKFIQKLKSGIKPDRPKGNSIYDLLGIDIGDDGKEALKSGFDFAKDQLISFFNLQKQLADQRVQQSNAAVSSAENELQSQIQLAQLGYANKVETAQKELALAKEQQRKALNEQKKAQKAELAIQTIQQGVNLATASSKILSTVPFPLSLAAVGVMFGAFAAAKIKAFQLTKKEFSEGGLEIIGGGTHASGNDTPLGFSVGGKQAYAERGESHMILKPGPTKKYRNVLPEIFNSLNSGTFENVFAYQSSMASQIPFTVVQSAPTNMGKTERELARIRQQGSLRTYTDGQGRTVEIIGNRKTIYV